MESLMPLGSLAYLAMVICGFGLFMIMLCYGWLKTAPPWRKAPPPATTAATHDEAPSRLKSAA
jgi:hypothetical protein